MGLPSPLRRRPTLGLPAIAAAVATAATTTAAAATATAATTEATAAAAAATTTEAAATAAAGSALLRLVHCEGAAVEDGAVHGAHRCLSSSLVSKRDECEAARAAGVAVSHHLGVVNLSKTFKCRAETCVVSVPAEAAYKESITHLLLHLGG